LPLPTLAKSIWNSKAFNRLSQAVTLPICKSSTEQQNESKTKWIRGAMNGGGWQKTITITLIAAPGE